MHGDCVDIVHEHGYHSYYWMSVRMLDPKIFLCAVFAVQLKAVITNFKRKSLKKNPKWKRKLDGAVTCKQQ